jgi:excisionase family DNA binding protein
MPISQQGDSMGEDCAEGALKQLMNPIELAVFLHCHISTIYHLVRRQQIPFVKINRMLRFEVHAIEDWVSELERT